MGKLVQDLPQGADSACSGQWGSRNGVPWAWRKGVPPLAPFQGPMQGCCQPQHPGKVQPHRAQLCSVQGPRTLVISPWRSLLPLGRVSTTPSLAPAGPGFLSPHSLFPSSPLPLCNSCQTHHTPQLCCPAEASGGAGDLGTHLPFLLTAPAAFPPLIVLGGPAGWGGPHRPPHTPVLPQVLKGHDDHVITCLQFCGNRIVSGSDDNTLKVWSAVTGEVSVALSLAPQGSGAGTTSLCWAQVRPHPHSWGQFGPFMTRTWSCAAPLCCFRGGEL